MSTTSRAALRGLTIGIIGAGNMGRAILGGLIRGGVPASALRVVEAKASARQAIRRAHRVRAVELAEAVERCAILIVAVKPQDVAPVLDALRAPPARRGRARLVISIAAGLTIAAIERRLGGVPVVRVMPNLPAKVGCAMSALAASRRVSPSQRAAALAIFRCIGEVVELPERHFDVVTAISGSGPAYVFLFLKALRDAGMRRGLPKAAAQRLAEQTLLGSVHLARALGEELDVLIGQVASKRGTTEAALSVFSRRGLARILDEGVGAAARRSKALSWSLSAS